MKVVAWILGTIAVLVFLSWIRIGIYVSAGANVKGTAATTAGYTCGSVTAESDAKGTFYRYGGKKYRMDVPPRDPRDVLCANGQHAYWESR